MLVASADSEAFAADTEAFAADTVRFDIERGIARMMRRRATLSRPAVDLDAYVPLALDQRRLHGHAANDWLPHAELRRLSGGRPFGRLCWAQAADAAFVDRASGRCVRSLADALVECAWWASVQPPTAACFSHLLPPAMAADAARELTATHDATALVTRAYSLCGISDLVVL